MTRQNQSSSQTPDLSEVIRQRFGIIALVTVSAIVFSLFASATIPPVYEARAVFYLLTDVATPTDPGDASAAADLALPLYNRTMSQAYLGVLRGPDFMRAVAERYPDMTRDDLRPSAIHVQNTSSGLMAAYVRNQDPEKAARIANALVSYFREYIQQPVATSSERSRVLVEEELATVTAGLDEAIRRRQDYLEQNSLSSIPVERQSLSKRLVDLNFERDTLEIAAEAALREIELLETSAMRDRLALLSSSIDANRAKINGLNKAIGQTNAEIRRLEVVNETFAELNADVDRLSASKDTLERTENNMNLVSLQLSNVELIAETARAPEKPVYPLTAVNAFVAAILGLFGGLAYSIFLGGLDVDLRTRRNERVAGSRWAKNLIETLPGV